MNDVEFEDYLERGWEYGANLFYNGRIYFMQCCLDPETKLFNFCITSFKAEKYSERSFSPYVKKDGGLLDYKVDFEVDCETCEEAKQICFSGKFYDGKSFWEIGKDFDWLEPDGPDIIVD